MSLPIVFRRVARMEFDQAADWYDNQQRGLGDRFTSAVRDVVRRAANQPDFYPPAGDRMREGMVQGFPYCVHYQEESGQLSVLAVIHNSRDPVLWQRRS